jgi:predicted nuclease with TOPRIM domain
LAPLERLRELRMEPSQLDERRAAILKEIERLESVAVVVREFDPFAVLDEQSPSHHVYLDLKSKTLAKECEAILRAKGQPASSRDLLEIFVTERKLAHGKNSSLIS